MAKASNKWNDPAEQDAEKKMQKKGESEKERERERDLPSGAPGTVFIEHTRALQQCRESHTPAILLTGFVFVALSQLCRSS